MLLALQRKEIREGVSCVKHKQWLVLTSVTITKEIFSGDNALKAGGTANTMGQFS